MKKGKNCRLELESAQAGLNAISKEIGQLMAKGEKAGADEKKRKWHLIKSGSGPLQQALDLNRYSVAAVIGNPAQPAGRRSARGQNTGRQ